MRTAYPLGREGRGCPGVHYRKTLFFSSFHVPRASRLSTSFHRVNMNFSAKVCTLLFLSLFAFGEDAAPTPKKTEAQLAFVVAERGRLQTEADSIERSMAKVRATANGQGDQASQAALANEYNRKARALDDNKKKRNELDGRIFVLKKEIDRQKNAAGAGAQKDRPASEPTFAGSLDSFKNARETYGLAQLAIKNESMKAAISAGESLDLSPIPIPAVSHDPRESERRVLSAVNSENAERIQLKRAIDEYKNSTDTRADMVEQREQSLILSVAHYFSAGGDAWLIKWRAGELP